MTTYNELVAYFESIPTLIPGIKGVTVGADEDLISMQNTRIQYPHLWVETPGLRFVGTDENPSTRFDLALVLIRNDASKTNPAANARLSEMLNLMTMLWAQLLADADADLFDLNLGPATGEPIRRWSADNAYGWRLEIAITIQRLECGPPIDVWTPDPITGDTHEYVLPAGHLLVAVYLKSDEAQEVSIGTTNGGDQIGGPSAGPGGTPIIFSALNHYAENDTTLFITGLAGTNVLKVWTIFKA